MPKLNARHFTLNAKSGLTLIELLVVISIIGILASLATFTYTDSQAKSRDSRRKANIDAIRKALELAKQDSAGAYSYPICATYGAPATNACLLSSDGAAIIGSTPLAPTYIKSTPRDPKSDIGYAYWTYDSAGTGSCTGAGTCPRFKLIACLENTKDPQIDSANDALSCTTTGTKSYTITNL